MLKSIGSFARPRPSFAALVALAALLFSASACQFSGSFEGTRCSQQSDCPADARCVEGYCMAPQDLGDASGELVMAINLAPESLELSVGDRRALGANAYDEQSQPVEPTALSWESSDPAIASVDDHGEVSALAVGTAVITASADGVFDIAQITVSETAAASLEVEPGSIELKPGESTAAHARVLDASGEELADRTIHWSSAKPSVAVVDDSGEILALTSGQTTITARSGAAEGAVQVNVAQPELTVVELSPTSLELVEGDTFALRATVRDEFGDIVEDAPVDWSSSDEDTVTVDDQGVVSALRSGGATITAQISAADQSGAAEATAEVSVGPAAVGSLTVEPSAATLEVGGALSIDARANAANGSYLDWPTFSYASSDDTIATVDADGLVQAHQPGVVGVAVRAGGLEKSVAINVIPRQVAGLSVSPSESDIEIGGHVQLGATVEDADGSTIADPFVVWESSDTDIAAVDSTGRVVGVSEGSAQITARTENDTHASATVNVTARTAASIDLRPQSATIEEAQTLALTATVIAADNTVMDNAPVTFSSADPSVATVDSDGVVTGVDAGSSGQTVSITASSGNNASASVDVTIEARPVADVEVDPPLETIAVGATATFTATARAADASALSGHAITWSSVDDSIASVDDGEVTGHSPGVTVIKATVGTKSGFASVRVVPDNEAPSASSQSVSTPEDAPLDITLSAADPDGDALTYGIDRQPSHGTISDFDATTGQLTYTPEADFHGADFFIYTVDDGGGAVSAYVDVTVTPVNDAPVAHAGADQTVDQGETVELNASQSSDVEGGPLTYTWDFASEPNGQPAELSDASSVAPSFVAHNTGEYVIDLTVDDGEDTDTATVTITVQ